MKPTAEERIADLITCRLEPWTEEKGLDEVIEVIAHELHTALEAAYADGQRDEREHLTETLLGVEAPCGCGCCDACDYRRAMIAAIRAREGGK